jgi:hypothetical protein
VLEKIEAGGCNVLSQRPTIGAGDLPLLAWRAWGMRRLAAATPPPVTTDQGLR